MTSDDRDRLTGLAQPAILFCGAMGLACVRFAGSWRQIWALRARSSWRQSLWVCWSTSHTVTAFTSSRGPMTMSLPDAVWLSLANVAAGSLYASRPTSPAAPISGLANHRHQQLLSHRQLTVRKKTCPILYLSALLCSCQAPEGVKVSTSGLASSPYSAGCDTPGTSYTSAQYEDKRTVPLS